MFILSGCSVVEGDAVYLVTAVGRNSEWGKILTELDSERPDTPLQVVLNIIMLDSTLTSLFSRCLVHSTYRGPIFGASS